VAEAGVEPPLPPPQSSTQHNKCHLLFTYAFWTARVSERCVHRSCAQGVILCLQAKEYVKLLLDPQSVPGLILPADPSGAGTHVVEEGDPEEWVTQVSR